MTIDEIYNSESISIRSYNVCNDNDLKDLTSILRYYQEYKTFGNLRNCGRRSNEELIELCRYYTKKFPFFEDKIIKQENALIKKIENLTRNQREIINSFIEINIKALSIRSQNAITSFLKGNIKIRNISDQILTNNSFNTKKIQNVGEKSVIELDSFIKTVTEFTEEVIEIETEKDLIALKNKFLIQKKYSISNIPNEILESQSIFKLVDYLINQNVIFEKNQNLLFKKAFKIYHDQPELTLDIIAGKIKITRERARQIRKTCLAELFEKFQFIKSIDDDLIQKYYLDNSQEYINIDELTLNLINEQNETNFSREFISYLIYTFWSDEFELVGNLEDVLQSRQLNSRNRYNWNNFYLVRKSLNDEFYFNAFLYDLDSRLNERIEETYSFNLKSYLVNFLKNNNYEKLTPLAIVAEKIINDEFGISIDLDDNLNFIKNTSMSVSDCAIEALEKLGVPSKIEDIYYLIEKEHPEITKSKDALRGSLQRTHEIIYFGRSSTFGLKRWETEREGIKGGTIKDIVLEYLTKNTDPIHINEILNEVHKYRDDTNAKNIITNLKLDPQKQFIVFNQSFVGLKRKTYQSNLTELPKFLGKRIVNYVKLKYSIDQDILIQYFSDSLSISKTNTSFIIQQLIENGFLVINDQNKLTL